MLMPGLVIDRKILIEAPVEVVWRNREASRYASSDASTGRR
jgi:hypothetical protein